MEQDRTTVEEIAAFALTVQADDLADEALDRLKRSVFDRLAAPFAASGLRAEIVACVRQLETLPVSALTALLARTGAGHPA